MLAAGVMAALVATLLSAQGAVAMKDMSTSQFNAAVSFTQHGLLFRTLAAHFLPRQVPIPARRELMLHPCYAGVGREGAHH